MTICHYLTALLEYLGLEVKSENKQPLEMFCPILVIERKNFSVM